MPTGLAAADGYRHYPPRGLVQRGTDGLRIAEQVGCGLLQLTRFLQGSGTELAACPINYRTAEKTEVATTLQAVLATEAWIRAHPSFRGNVPQNTPVAALKGAVLVGIADELTQLAQLPNAGVLSPEEFDQSKAKLLG